MYLKRKLCIVANEFSFEIGRISVMRACVLYRARPILYGTPCNSFLWSRKRIFPIHISYLQIDNVRNVTKKNGNGDDKMNLFTQKTRDVLFTSGCHEEQFRWRQPTNCHKKCFLSQGQKTLWILKRNLKLLDWICLSIVVLKVYNYTRYDFIHCLKIRKKQNPLKYLKSSVKLWQ